MAIIALCAMEFSQNYSNLYWIYWLWAVQMRVSLWNLYAVCYSDFHYYYYHWMCGVELSLRNNHAHC